MYFTSEITLYVAQIVNSEQLQHYIPRNMVCFRYLLINTLHKGDGGGGGGGGGGGDEDDDNNNNNNNVGVRELDNLLTVLTSFSRSFIGVARVSDPRDSLLLLTTQEFWFFELCWHAPFQARVH